jgi:hypothetical protein
VKMMTGTKIRVLRFFGSSLCSSLRCVGLLMFGTPTLTLDDLEGNGRQRA